MQDLVLLIKFLYINHSRMKTIYMWRAMIRGGAMLALGLGQLGHYLGPATRWRPQILGQNLIYLKKESLSYNKKKIVL